MEDQKVYGEEELIENIYFFPLEQILKTQKLSYDFVCDYILNEDFHLLPNEEKLTIEIVLKYQPHLEIYFTEKTNHLFKKEISWPYFEIYANK